MPWVGSGLYFASRARGVIENARLTRSRRGRAARALSRAELETFLERKLDSFGATGLNKIRDEARAIAPALAAENELQVVEQLSEPILGARQVQARSPLLRARQAGLASALRRGVLLQPDPRDDLHDRRGDSDRLRPRDSAGPPGRRARPGTAPRDRSRRVQGRSDPFNDGNGRIARIMMNAELVAAGEQRIIVAPAMREGYVGALRNLSVSHDPSTLVRVLPIYQRFTGQIDFSDLHRARRELEAKHVMEDAPPSAGLLDVLMAAQPGGAARSDR